MGLLGKLFSKGPKVIAPWSQSKRYSGGHRKGAPLTGKRARRGAPRSRPLSVFPQAGRRVTPTDTPFRWFG